MLTLHIYAPQFNEPSASPFCTKAMCLLQMSGLDWRVDMTGDPRRMPHAKLPVLQDGTQMIADSATIRLYLEQRMGVEFDQHLTPIQRAQAHSLTRMVEEHLYFAITCDRWLDDANWAIVRNLYFAKIPKLIRRPITRKIRAQARAAALGQGMARHSVSERLVRVQRDMDAIRITLAEQPFLFGDTPSSADASVAPMLAAAGASPCPTPLRDYVRADAALQAYLGRVRAAIYPI